MPGPKYVKDFTYPSSFGFSGSSTDSPSIPVKPHDRARPQRFAEGGRVKRRLSAYSQAGIDAENQGRPTPRPPPGSIPPKKPKATPKADEKLSATELFGGKGRRQREQELGLKKGGRVPSDMAQDRKLVKTAISQHIRAPKPKGHGVR